MRTLPTLCFVLVPSPGGLAVEIVYYACSSQQEAIHQKPSNRQGGQERKDYAQGSLTTAYLASWGSRTRQDKRPACHVTPCDVTRRKSIFRPVHPPLTLTRVCSRLVAGWPGTEYVIAVYSAICHGPLMNMNTARWKSPAMNINATRCKSTSRHTCAFGC